MYFSSPVSLPVLPGRSLQNRSRTSVPSGDYSPQQKFSDGKGLPNYLNRVGPILGPVRDYLLFQGSSVPVPTPGRPWSKRSSGPGCGRLWVEKEVLFGVPNLVQRNFKRILNDTNCDLVPFLIVGTLTSSSCIVLELYLEGRIFIE